MAEKIPHHSGYRPDVDGLRAIAVLAVVAFHVSPTTVTGGFVGVDVFFVISGFLISSILIKGLDAGTFSYTDFYIRRIRRIFPALIIVFLFVLLAGWLLLLPGEYTQLGKHVAAGSLFVSNFALWTEAGYFDTESAQKPLLHLWSLGVEEQFYIVWPLLLALLWRIGRCRLRCVLAAGVASLMLCWFMAGSDPTAAFYLPLARFWELLVGAALAIGTIRYAAAARTNGGSGSTAVRVLTSAPVANACALIGLALVLLAIVGVDSRSAFPWLRAAAPTLGTAMIIGAGPNAYVNRFVLAHKAVVFVGLISYPLYLWHWPLLSMLGIVLPPPGTGAYKIAAVLVAFALATATYLFIEKPVRRPPYVRVRWLIAGSSACLLAAIAVVATSGFADERGPWNLHAADSPSRSELQTPTCAMIYGAAFQPRLFRERDFCVKGHAGPDDVVVVGDSHANRLFFGLQAVDPSRSYVNLGRGTCLPLLGFDGSWLGEELICPETTRAILERAVHSGARTIILHSYFVRAHEGVEVKPTGNFAAQARATFKFLSRSGVNTLVVLDVPTLSFHPSTCLARPAIKAYARAHCSEPAKAWSRRVASTNAALRAAAAGLDHIEFFDPSSVLCDAQACDAARNGELLYLDPHHLSLAGAAVVAAALVRQSSELTTDGRP